MKTPHNTPATRLALSTAGLILLVLLTVVPVARAVTITATITAPNNSSFAVDPAGFALDSTNMDTWPVTESNPIFGTFNFSSSYLSLDPAKGLQGFSGVFQFQNLDTVKGTGGIDFNNITFALGGLTGPMYDTGILVNGFTNSKKTLTVFGNPNLAGNAAAIYTALVTGGGYLRIGMLDVTSDPSNPFLFGNAAIKLQIADQAIPFEPTQTLGFGVLAALFAFRRFPQLKRFFARA